MQSNFTSLFTSTIAPVDHGAYSEALPVFAAGALSGAGVTFLANGIRDTSWRILLYCCLACGWRLAPVRVRWAG